MTAERMTCPTCGRQNVAVRLVGKPRIQAGRPVPRLRVPARHKRLGWTAADAIAGRDWCEPERRPS